MKTNNTSRMNEKLLKENMELKKRIEFLSNNKTLEEIKLALKQIESGKYRLYKGPFKG